MAFILTFEINTGYNQLHYQTNDKYTSWMCLCHSLYVPGNEDKAVLFDEKFMISRNGIPCTSCHLPTIKHSTRIATLNTFLWLSIHSIYLHSNVNCFGTTPIFYSSISKREQAKRAKLSGEHWQSFPSVDSNHRWHQSICLRKTLFWWL